MRQCELEKVISEKGSFHKKRTGEKMIAFIDGVTSDMVGSIVDLRKVEGLWVIDKIYDVDIEKHQIRRSWHVGGL